jgi:uncharacterized membrane protein
MSYEGAISEVVKVVEAVGAAIMVFGGLGAFVVFLLHARRAETAETAYTDLRRNLSRLILLGLEVLIVADIVRTIIVESTLESVAVLGIIVVIRILLSFSLEVEIDGAWPWRRRQLESEPRSVVAHPVDADRDRKD